MKCVKPSYHDRPRDAPLEGRAPCINSDTPPLSVRRLTSGESHTEREDQNIFTMRPRFF